MCFSLEASFIASFFLAGVAIASFRKVRLQQVNFKRFYLVLIPAGFAIQQFCEGFVWMALLNNYDGLFRNIAIYGFIFFAFIFWPAYVPVCMYQLEQNRTVQKFLKLCIVIGLTTAALLLERVIYFGVTAQLANCHILYQSDLSQFSAVFTWLVMGAYLLATVGSLLVSTYPKVRLLGILIGLAYVAAYLFYVNFLISVWCFFAALITMLVYWLVSKNK